jgi:transposase
VQKNITRKTAREHAPEVTTEKLSALMEAHKKGEAIAARLTIGLDLGDRVSCFCVLDDNGEVIGRGVVGTERQSVAREFQKFPLSRVALEVGTQSPWVSRILKQLGHEVIVANARQVKPISESSRKNDRLDAEFVARLARADQKLLAPVRHRSEVAQADLTLVRVRAQLMELRTPGGQCGAGIGEIVRATIA